MTEPVSTDATEATTETRDKLISTAARASDPAVFLDFDGVLSNLTDDPGEAVPIDGTIEVIDQLIDVGFEVTIVSSRDIKSLQNHFSAIPELTIVGSAGLEKKVAGEIEVDDDVSKYLDDLENAETEARSSAPDGVGVERKSYGLSLHYRTSPQAEPEAKKLGRSLAERFGLAYGDGRDVVELRLPINRSKGDAIRDHIDQRATTGKSSPFDWAMFAGDDEPDIAGFSEIHNISSGTPTFDGFAVGVAGDAATRANDFTSAVDYLVDDPAALQTLLRELVDARTQAQAAIDD